MSKSHRRPLPLSTQKEPSATDLAYDHMDKSMETLNLDYARFVSLWIRNELAAGEKTYEQACVEFVRNFLVIDAGLDFAEVGRRIKREEDQEAEDATI